MHKQPFVLIVIGTACVAAGIVGGTRRTSTPAGAAPAAATFAIKDARLFDGDDVRDRATVLVRDGKIAAIAADLPLPAGTTVIEGAGRTLLPGLIDAHSHAFATAPARALVFGVTTELDMFTDHRQAAGWRAEQQSPAGAPGRADIFSAGTLVTAPKGHGTQFGLPIPTLESAAGAAAFVDARIAEGSDYIKVVYDRGNAYGLSMPSISPETLAAVVAAARNRGKVAVVHIGTRADAEAAIAAGASGLVHIFAGESPGADFARKAKAAGAFIIPTLSVIESAAGTAGGAALSRAATFAPFLTSDEQSALQVSFPLRRGSTIKLEHALEATRGLHAAGVVILAGSDAPNTGTIHGASIHRELELLVQAGLSPQAALTAATAAPARAFGLNDRGRIAPGFRADLLLVGGNPLADITATRLIEAVWKGGVKLDRRAAPAPTQTAQAVSSGRISDFEGSEVAAAFGAGWQISTDTLMGGTSEASMRLVKPGASGSAGALAVAGAIKPGSPFPWAGAMFFPASPPMAPADVSAFKEIVFNARGDGREYQLMIFATRLGNMPASQPFTPRTEWSEHAVPLKSFGVDGSDLRGILFSASTVPGGFSFAVDNVRLR